MLEEPESKYEEHRDKKYVNDLTLQRLYEHSPSRLGNSWRLKSAHESVKRRANNWTTMNSTGRADIDLKTMGNGREHEDHDGGEELDSSGDLMERKEGKKPARIGQHNGYGYQYGQW